MATFDPIEIEKSLQGIDYPASQEDLCDTARENGAPDDVMITLQSLPERQYDDAVDVLEELGHGDDAVPTEGDAPIEIEDDDDLGGLSPDDPGI